MVELSLLGYEDSEQVVRFMDAVFTRAKWSTEGWRRLLDGRWSPPDHPCAVAAFDRGGMVGVIGIVATDRPTPEGPRRWTNLTSWYLEKPYRGQGIGSAMMAMAGGEPHATVTNFTSARGAAPAALRSGMVPLETVRLLWDARQPVAPPLPVHREPLALGATLPEMDRQVLEDHRGLGLTGVTVETPDGPCTLILSIKRKRDGCVTHEALYLGDAGLFARHARRIADSLLPAGGAELSVDRRFLPARVRADRTETIPIPRYYRPGGMPRHHIDYLYSEVALLDMKLS
jgi:GNAT superfamily N-acetyltransferase